MTDKMRFEAWLRAEGYAESSIAASLCEAELIQSHWDAGRPLSRRLRWVARRMIRANCAPTGVRFTEQVDALFAEQPRVASRAQKRRQKVHRSVDDETWKKLFDAVSKDKSDEARVVEVMMSTGLRIGDVLRKPRRELLTDVRHGNIAIKLKGGDTGIFPLDDSWKKLLAAWRADKDRDARSADNVAGWICPTNTSPLAGSCAYRRVERRLKALAKSVGIAERIHTHRLRRTVAVQALRVEKDVLAVQQLLGHANAATTSRYLDEARPEAVSAVTAKIKERFRGSE